jgi:hypothetical protein
VERSECAGDEPVRRAHERVGAQVDGPAGAVVGVGRILRPVPVVEGYVRIDRLQKLLEAVAQLPVPRDEGVDLSGA